MALTGTLTAVAADYRSLPATGREEVARDLRTLGLRAGDTVLVHSSLSRIGYVDGGAATVVDAFLDVLGPTGTLAVPTFPFTGSMLAYVRSDPDFDVDETPSKMGAITEALRLRPGALRSFEPTHPVSALGPEAEFLVEDHVNADGPCDAHSPLYRLTQLPRGHVLLLGVDFRNCTLLHTAEELARVPFIDFTTHYRLRGRTRRAYGVAARHPLGSPGPTVLLSRAAYVLSIYCHSTPLRANFPAIEPVLRERGLLTAGRVGAADCRLARAADILSVAMERLRDDPYFLRVREPRQQTA